MRRSLALFTSVLLLIIASQDHALAQEKAPKFEVGIQAVGVRTSYKETTFVTLCVILIDGRSFCELDHQSRWDAGFGGRLGYNFSRYVSAEIELNFIPHEDTRTLVAGGRKVEALFGVKAGMRNDRVGIFAKARPGLVRYGRFKEQPFSNSNPGGKSKLALDLGGVIEWYPTPNILTRVDVGDTLIRESEYNFVKGNLRTTHNLQINAGIGFRF
jgi:hypothetical protein